MNLNVEVNAREWNQAVNDYVRLLGMNAADVLRDQTRALASACIKLTPPFDSSGSAPSDKDAGEQSVMRNLERAIKPADSMVWKNPALKLAWERIVAAGDAAAAERFLHGIKGFKSHRVLPFNPEIHRKSLDKRGRAHSTRVVTLESPEWLGYLVKLLMRVGLARSGWLAAYYGAGGTAGKLGMPWVTRHGSGRTGSVNLNLTAANPTVEIMNWAKGIRNYEFAFRRALALRARSMSHNLRRTLAKAAKQAGTKFGRYQTTYRLNDEGRWEITGAA